MQTGALMARGLAPSGPPPDYLAFHPSGRYLYALNEVNPGRVVAFSVNATNGALTRLNDVSSGGSGPAHISMHKSGRWVLSSNYDSGHATALPIMADGRLGPPAQVVFAGTQAHMILDDGVSGRFVFVPAKGDNRILQYRFDDVTGRLEPNSPAAVSQGGVPRHMAFHRSGRFAYLLTEAGRTVVSYRYDSTTGLLADAQMQAAAPSGNGSHIGLHPNKEILYALVRAFDGIAIFTLDANGRPGPPRHVRDEISVPWDFAFDPTGKFMIVANNGSATVKAFRVAEDTGMLTLVGSAATAPRPRFVGVLAPPPPP